MRLLLSGSLFLLLLFSSAKPVQREGINMRLYCEKDNELSLMHSYKITWGDDLYSCNVANHGQAKCLVSADKELLISMRSCAEQQRQCPQIPKCDGIKLSLDSSLKPAMKNGFLWVRKDNTISGEVDDMGGEQGLKVRLENGKIANREVLTKNEEMDEDIVRAGIIITIVVIVVVLLCCVGSIIGIVCCVRSYQKKQSAQDQQMRQRYQQQSQKQAPPSDNHAPQPGDDE